MADYQTWLEFAALAVACASLGMTYLRTARMQGSERQRIRALEDAMLRLATAESVAALASRLDALEGEVKLVVGALTKVAVIESKLDSLDRLMTREAEEMKHALRDLQARASRDAGPAQRRGRALNF